MVSADSPPPLPSREWRRLRRCSWLEFEAHLHLRRHLFRACRPAASPAALGHRKEKRGEEAGSRTWAWAALFFFYSQRVCTVRFKANGPNKSKARTGRRSRASLFSFLFLLMFFLFFFFLLKNHKSDLNGIF